MTDLDAFIAGLPKAELHVHIEGTLEPELMFALAARNGVALPFADVEAVRAAYAFSNLQDFLDIYYAGAAVLLTAADFHDLAIAYFERAAADGVVHAEVMFDPQTHTARGVAFAEVIGGLLSAMDEARARFGMTSLLIMSFLRHLSEDDAFATLAEAEPWLGRITAVGLDSSELGHPPEKFARVFAAARARGLKCTAHAGEEGPPAYVAGALDALAVDRIDHGNRSLEDPALVRRLADRGMTLTVCPLSNLKLKGIARMEDHPIAHMLASRLRVTINSDDPAYFGGYVGANYRAVYDHCGLTRQGLAICARNSLAGSFLPGDAIAAHLATLQEYMADAC